MLPGISVGQTGPHPVPITDTGGPIVIDTDDTDTDDTTNYDNDDAISEDDAPAIDGIAPMHAPTAPAPISNNEDSADSEDSEDSDDDITHLDRLLTKNMYEFLWVLQQVSPCFDRDWFTKKRLYDV